MVTSKVTDLPWEQQAAVDDVMNLFYDLSATISRLDPSYMDTSGDVSDRLKRRGTAYIDALLAVVKAANGAATSMYWGEDGAASFFWTHKIMLRTKWALANGAPPEIVRFLAHVHFT